MYLPLYVSGGGSGRGLGTWSYTYASLTPSPTPPRCEWPPWRPCRSSGSPRVRLEHPTTLPGKDPLQSQPVARFRPPLDSKNLDFVQYGHQNQQDPLVPEITPQGHRFRPYLEPLGNLLGQHSSPKHLLLLPKGAKMVLRSPPYASRGTASHPGCA